MIDQVGHLRDNPIIVLAEASNDRLDAFLADFLCDARQAGREQLRGIGFRRGLLFRSSIVRHRLRRTSLIVC